MATTRRTSTVTNTQATQTVEVAQVVESTIKDPKMKGEESSATVAIAVCLIHGIEFDDIPDGKGGYKSIVFPGINSHLKGLKEGILTSGGDALCINIPKSDWEHIKRLYGSMGQFKSYNGLPPCIMELNGGKDEFDHSDKVKAQENGDEPLTEKEILPEKIK